MDLFHFDFEAMTFYVGDSKVELSKTEQKLLRLLVENRGRTMTRGDLVDRVWTDGAEYVDTGLLHQYSDCGGVFCPLFTTTTVKRGRFGKRSGNFFVFPVCSLQQSGGVVCQRFLKMGAKKAVNLFKIYCLSAAVMGGGIKLSAVFQMEFICNRFLFAFQSLFCNLP